MIWFSMTELVRRDARSLLCEPAMLLGRTANRLRSAGKMKRNKSPENATAEALPEAASSQSPRFIQHRVTGEFAVFDHETVVTDAVVHSNGKVEIPPA
jgi:hypothetical protein